MRRLTATPDARSPVGDLYETEGARLWRAVFAWCQDRAVADDAVAEAFAQCLRRGDEIRDRRAWVWTAAFRLAGGELKSRRRFAVDDESRDRSVEEPSTDVVDLLIALRRLSTNQRAALVLRYYGGWETDEIARALGTGRATVRVHLSRGRRHLRQLLEGDD
jgi:RNA polymerase sigma-70 factor (ECF subfamily)